MLFRSSYAGPFDPDVVQVEVELVPEVGEPATRTGFWFQGYESTLDESMREVLVPVGDPHFRVRFRTDPGTRYQVTARATDADGTGQMQLDELYVSGTTPDPFVRLRTDGVTGLEREGRPWVPFGANVCWSGARGTWDFADWFGRMAGSSRTLNWSRLWMTHFDGTALGWKAGGDDGAYQGLGSYNLKAAWRVDRILDLAASSGIALQLVLQQHSQFECDKWSSWADNPWNAANGGPCATSMEFFTNPDVVAGFDRRLRYIVARYAHSPAILAWELWNEVDLIQGFNPEVELAWAQERVAKLRAMDPEHHLVTTSGALPGFDDPARGPGIYDIVQLHHYMAIYMDMLPLFAPQLRALGKPVLLGEFGIDYQGQLNLQDTEGTHLVNATILAVVSGLTGGAMSWWWDNYLDPNGLWTRLASVAEVLLHCGAAYVTGHLDDVQATGDEAVDARAAALENGALVWVHDRESEYDRREDWQPATHTGVTVRVGGIVPEEGACTWQVYWHGVWKDAGMPIAERTGIQEGDAVAIEVPDFERDLLARVSCLPLQGADEPGGGEPGVEDAPPEQAEEDRDTLDEAGDPALSEELDDPLPRRPGGCSARF